MQSSSLLSQEQKQSRVIIQWWIGLLHSRLITLNRCVKVKGKLVKLFNMSRLRPSCMQMLWPLTSICHIWHAAAKQPCNYVNTLYTVCTLTVCVDVRCPFSNSFESLVVMISEHQLHVNCNENENANMPNLKSNSTKGQSAETDLQYLYVWENNAAWSLLELSNATKIS